MEANLKFVEVIPPGVRIPHYPPIHEWINMRRSGHASGETAMFVCFLIILIGAIAFFGTQTRLGVLEQTIVELKSNKESRMHCVCRELTEEEIKAEDDKVRQLQIGKKEDVKGPSSKSETTTEEVKDVSNNI